MFENNLIDYRAHDLASKAALLHYQMSNELISDSNAFEFGILYRNIYKEIRRSLEEAESDLT